MPTLTTEIEFSIKCDCGEDLYRNVTSTTDRRGMAILAIDPCEKCLENKYNKGHEDGVKEAKEDNE